MALAALVIGGVFMAWQLWPENVKVKSEPGFLDLIFMSRLMIWVARMLLFVGTVYVVGSVVALIAQNMWLSDFGPLKVSELFAKLQEKLADKRLDEAGEQLEAALKDVDELSKRLEERDEELARALDEIARLRGFGQGQSDPS